MSTRTLVPVLKYGLTARPLWVDTETAPDHYSPRWGDSDTVGRQRLSAACGVSFISGG